MSRIVQRVTRSALVGALLARRRSTGGNVAVVVVLRTLALAVNVLTGLLTAALLGPAGRGEQAALIIAPTLLSSLSSLGLHASLIFSIKRDPEHTGHYFGTGLLLALGAGIVAMVAGWFLVPFWLHQYDRHVVSVARLLLVMTPLMVVAQLLTGALEAFGQFSKANATLYLQSLGTLAFLLVLWLLDVLTPVTAAFAYLVPAVPAWLYFASHLRRLTRPRFSLQRRWVWPLLHYGLRFYGVDLLGSLSIYLDQIVVVTLLAPDVVGTYVVALSLSRVVGVLQGAAATVLFPSVAAQSKASVVEAVSRTVRVVGAVSVLIVVCLSIVGPGLITLVYGHRFDQTVAPFRILLIDTVLSGSAGILYQAYSGTGRPELVTLFEAVAVAASLGCMLLVVPHYGTVGAAWCVVLASAIRLSCAIAGMPLVLHVSIPRLLLTRSDIVAMARHS